MARSRWHGWNPERGVFLVFAALLALAAVSYVRGRPKPPDLVSPRVPERGEIRSAEAIRARAGREIVARADREAFVPPELAQIEEQLIRRRTPEQPPAGTEAPSPLPQTVHLAPRPTDPDERPEGEGEADPSGTEDGEEGDAAEADFPLRVVAFHRPTGDAPRRVTVRPETEGEAGPRFLDLAEGEEWHGLDEHIKVLDLTDTSVRFERADGSVVVVDLDPMRHGWRGRGEARDADVAPAEEAADGEVAPEGDAPPPPGDDAGPTLTPADVEALLEGAREVAPPAEGAPVY